MRHSTRRRDREEWRKRRRKSRGRRVLNVTVALIGLIILAPVMLAIALLIKATSNGPVIYSQPRVGIDRRWRGRQVAPGLRVDRGTADRRAVPRAGERRRWTSRKPPIPVRAESRSRGARHQASLPEGREGSDRDSLTTERGPA